jgi:molybdopterin/thiamine biosynthesis adenylyltransferase
MSRYSRQERLAQIGPAGQQALGRSTVLAVGIGALGTHSVNTLARAGVGRLLLCDRDVVDESNLQRQVLFDEADAEAGTPKAVAAVEHLRRVNHTVDLEPIVAHCDRHLLEGLPSKPDLVLDGTDNFSTRYLLNDWCRREGISWIYAGAVGTEGSSMVVTPEGPCLRCLWPTPPDAAGAATCETAGVLAPTIAAVTAFQTAEAIKLLAGRGQDTTRGVFLCDLWRGHFQVVATGDSRRADCVTCARQAYPALDDRPTQTAILCGRDAVQIDPTKRAVLDLTALAAQLEGSAADVVRTPHLLRFAADGVRFSVFPSGRALLFGVQDPLRAQALFDRWVGS